MKTLHIEDFFALCNWSQTIDFCNTFQRLISQFHDHSAPTYMSIEAYDKNPAYLIRVHARFWKDRNGYTLYELKTVDVFDTPQDFMAMMFLDASIRRQDGKDKNALGTADDINGVFAKTDGLVLNLN